MEAPEKSSIKQQPFPEQNTIPVPEAAPANVVSEDGEVKSLARFRLAIWGLWFFYAIAIVTLYWRVYHDSTGLVYGLALSVLSAPGAAALMFWRPRVAFVSKRLYLQFGNLTVLAFFTNFFLFYAVLKHFISTDGAAVSLILVLLNTLLHGGLVWLVFFKKEAAYITGQASSVL